MLLGNKSHDLKSLNTNFWLRLRKVGICFQRQLMTKHDCQWFPRLIQCKCIRAHAWYETLAESTLSLYIYICASWPLKQLHVMKKLTAGLLLLARKQQMVFYSLWANNDPHRMKQMACSLPLWLFSNCLTDKNLIYSLFNSKVYLTYGGATWGYHVILLERAVPIIKTQVSVHLHCSCQSWSLWQPFPHILGFFFHDY